MSTSNNSLGGLKTLIQGQAGNVGLDDDASSVLIRNLDATTVPMCIGSPFSADESETDDFRLIMFVIDGSGSMEDVEGEVRSSFNEIVMPGLLEGAAPQVGAIRFNGLKFGNRVESLWSGGWQPLTRDFPKLDAQNYRPDGCTALHKAVLDAITAATAQALEIEQKTGTQPEIVIAVLSDGANNQPPRDTAEIRKVTDQLSRELFTLVFIGFETYERVDAKKIAGDLGFGDYLESKAKPGESPADQRRRFRHVMKVFSDKLITRTSQSQVGKSVAQTGSTGFWDDDTK